ncbi:hypothetical protein LUZ60_015508 [Juncus effusus]|nr:hypothetical protein LUZ60_015508 [Juncus effusus]
MSLSQNYHTLIQALLSRGPLREEEFHEIFVGVSGKNPVTHQKLFNEVLLKINRELAYVQFELRACRNQYDGKIYYGVVNNVADEQSKLGSKYSVPQIAFYKGVIEAIINEAGTEGHISNIDALNIRLENQIPAGQGSQDSQSRVPVSFKNFSMSQKERTLKDFITDRWLSLIGPNRIGLGVRSFLDLRSWFRANEVPSCDVCNEAGVRASVCLKEGCTVRIHDYCLKKKFSKRTGSRACPGCGTEWPQLEHESEQEEQEEETQQQEEEETETTTNLSNRRRLRSAKAEPIDQSQSQSQRKRQRGCKMEAPDRPAGAESSQPESSRRVTRSRRA